jgi:hypothetical protein
LCCSNAKCVHSNLCLQGQKLYKDYCDFNFECFSRCCDDNICAHFATCYEKCMTNSDCVKTTGCCSQGFCTDKKICLSGGKIKGEYCDVHSECKTKLYCLNNQCVESFFAFLPRDVIVLVIIIAVAIVALSIFIYCCFKLCSGRSSKTTDKNQGGKQQRKNSITNEGSP